MGRFSKWLAVTLAVTVMAAGAPLQSRAMLAPADPAEAAADVDRVEDMKTIQTALESELLRRRLGEFKLTPEQVNERLGQLSSEQVHEAALQINALHPGGDVAGVLVVALLVILIIYLLQRI